MFSACFRHDKASPMAYARSPNQPNQAVLAHLTGKTMTLDPVLINPLIALIAGILILLMPRLLTLWWRSI